MRDQNAFRSGFYFGSVLVPRQISFVTSFSARVGRVTPCAPRSADSFPNGAHGVTRPTTFRNMFVTVLVLMVLSATAQQAAPLAGLPLYFEADRATTNEAVQFMARSRAGLFRLQF